MFTRLAIISLMLLLLVADLVLVRFVVWRR